jgi:hypothetical protein
MIVQGRRNSAARSGKSVGGALRAGELYGWDLNRMVRIERRIVKCAKKRNNAKASSRRNPAGCLLF